MPSTRSKSSEVAEQVESALAEETKTEKKVEAGEDETIKEKCETLKNTADGDTKDVEEEENEDDVEGDDDDKEEEGNGKEAKTAETDAAPKENDDTNNEEIEAVDGLVETKAEKRANDVTDANESPEKKAKLDTATDVTDTSEITPAAVEEKPNNGVQEAVAAVN